MNEPLINMPYDTYSTDPDFIKKVHKKLITEATQQLADQICLQLNAIGK